MNIIKDERGRPYREYLIKIDYNCPVRGPVSKKVIVKRHLRVVY